MMMMKQKMTRTFWSSSTWPNNNNNKQIIIKLIMIMITVCSLMCDQIFVQSSTINVDKNIFNSDIHQHLTPEERIVLLGHHKEVPQYQVILSKSLRTSSSYHQNLIHHHQSHFHHRTKRSINSNSNNKNNIASDKNEPIRVEFEAFGEPFRLRLWPNHDLLSPGFHLINQNRELMNNSIINQDDDWSMRKHLSNCFYQGYDEAHHNSAAAVSLCSGMQGVIETNPSIYLINPIPETTSKRIISYTNNNNNNDNNQSTTTSFQHDHYHLVLKKNDYNHYECPHGSTTNSNNHNHHHYYNDLHSKLSSSLMMMNNPNNNGNKNIFNQTRQKRSIDIVASNKNYFDADRTTTSKSTTITSSTTISPTTDNSLLSSTIENQPESINEINGDHHINSTTKPTFNITVETAVFIDESLYHVLSKTFPIDTEQQIVLYVLTIMNAVQLLFKQPSIGRSVDISVVLMDLLRQQPKNLTPSDNIDTYLTNFCVWQHKKRLRETGGPTPDWDHALLLSGINMYVVDGYGRRKRHVVGLAPVSGMCNSLNSCTISEGTNFQTVLVAGHEMGHSLGMEHDGSQDGNVCNKDDYVMSPTLGPGKTTWSECSKNYLDKFVLTSQATCVLGRSSHVNIIHQFIPPHRLPGERFNVDAQCRFRFGPTARHHSSQPKSEICRVIKCYVKSPVKNNISNSHHGFYSGRGLYTYPVKSTYNTHPALEGTECGQEKWCREGRCSAKANFQANNEITDIDHNDSDEQQYDINRYVQWELSKKNATIATTNNSDKLKSKTQSTRISNRHKKRPTAIGKINNDAMNTTSDGSPAINIQTNWHYHLKNDPYHYKLSNDPAFISSTPQPISSSTTKPSTILIVDNIYKSKSTNLKKNNNNEITKIVDTEANYLSDDQHNPYNKMIEKDRNHWSSNRLSQIHHKHQSISMNGNWSHWSDYGPCISECVAPGNNNNNNKGIENGRLRSSIMVPLGVQTSLRRCDSPSPMNGGQQCQGPDTRVKLCNALKTCSPYSATSAATGSGAKHRTKLDPLTTGHRYQIRSVDEYISDTCLMAAKFNDKIESHGTQYPSHDSASHSCFVWCYKRGGGFMTQGWRLPDGTPCGRKLALSSSVDSDDSAATGPNKDIIETTGYCYNGQCRRFNCRGEIFHRRSIIPATSSTNVYNAYQNHSTTSIMMEQELENRLMKDNCPSNYRLDEIIQDLEDQIDDWDQNYDFTYRLIQKVKNITPIATVSKSESSTQIPPIHGVDSKNTDSPSQSSPPSSPILLVATNPYLLQQNNWSDWHPVTECQYSISCIRNGRGFRLVTRECRRQTCLGRREALQVCPEVSTDKSLRNPSMTTMYNLYEQYCPVSIRRSANEYAQSICQKYQAKFSSLLSGNGQQLNYGCIVACEDRLWPDVHYQMDAFTDGRFPFGTDCSTNDRRGYCLNGKCIHFDKADISYDTAESVLYRHEILQLFAPSTIFPLEPTVYGSSETQMSTTTPSDSLYSAIFNQEIYKRASKTLSTPSPSISSIEHQPAYQSFISSHRRYKRQITTTTAATKIFRKASVQEQADPEGDYVSWTMLKHHHHNRPQHSFNHQHHHRQYRRPITRTMKNARSMTIDWSPLSMKPLRPIRLTSVTRKRKPQSSSLDSHFQTFTLVAKPNRNRLRTRPSLSSSSSIQPKIHLMKNITRFLDDDDDDDDDSNDDEQQNDKKPATKMKVSPTTKTNLTMANHKSMNQKSKAKFSMGHESWPPITTTTNISTFLDDNDDEDSTVSSINHDQDDDEDQLRVEPYIWSVILSECNRPCGEGIRTVRVVCTVGQRSVQENFCDQQAKPIHKSIETCKERDCIGRWRAEPWSKCFLAKRTPKNRCKQNDENSSQAFQTRTIACVGPMMMGHHNPNRLTESRIFSLLSHDYCDPLTRPNQWRSCDMMIDTNGNEDCKNHNDDQDKIIVNDDDNDADTNKDHTVSSIL